EPRGQRERERQRLTTPPRHRRPSNASLLGNKRTAGQRSVRRDGIGRGDGIPFLPRSDKLKLDPWRRYPYDAATVVLRIHSRRHWRHSRSIRRATSTATRSNVTGSPGLS